VIGVGGDQRQHGALDPQSLGGDLAEVLEQWLEARLDTEQAINGDGALEGAQLLGHALVDRYLACLGRWGC
jgi:hypothetical protein